MSDPHTWLQNNDEYLAAAVAWVHARLRRLAEAQMSRPAAPSPRRETPSPPAPADVAPAVETPPPAETPAPPPTAAPRRERDAWFGRLFRNTSESPPAAPAGPPAADTAPAAVVPAPTSAATAPSAEEPPPATPAASDDLSTLAAASLHAAASVSPPPAALWLQRAFGLLDFEMATLLLCAAVELDTRTSALCAQAQSDTGGAGRAYPTFALAMAAFEDPAWDVLSPDRPLRFWRLVEITQPSGHALTTSPLRADERIVNFLKGLNYLDDRLAPFVLPMASPEHAPPVPGAGLVASHAELASRIVERLEPNRRSGAAAGVAQPQRWPLSLPLVQLTGPDGESKTQVASEVTRQLGCQPYRLQAAALPAQPAELDQLARLWQREAALMPVALFVDAGDLRGEVGGDAPVLPPIERLLSRVAGLTFLACREPWPGLDPEALIAEVERPTPKEQSAVWRAALGYDAGDVPDQLANQFSLGVSAIGGIAARQIALGRTDSASLWSACLERARPRLDLLAERIQPRASWDDLVLPEDSLRLLHEVAAQVDCRSTVYEDWGFRRKMSRGLGISALFAGESGVGKTMAAEVLANSLQLNLYAIDLSAVVSKYIGQTEKNLRRLFDAADGGGAILFFDEADALFGKRSEVKDSHDRYANIEINYLLQRMESYTGLAILATNMRSALDPAFTRRLRFIVNFPVPGPVERRLIWQKVFPSEVPLETEDPVLKVDFDRLAKVNLSGGGIHNAALNAAFRAAGAKSKVTMPVLVDAIQTELKKMDRAVTPV